MINRDTRSFSTTAHIRFRLLGLEYLQVHVVYPPLKRSETRYYKDKSLLVSVVRRRVCQDVYKSKAAMITSSCYKRT